MLHERCPVPAWPLLFVLTGWYRSKERSKREVTMPTLAERITVDPEICHGKPTVRGLRYPVEPILELLSFGMTHAEILDDYPDLEDRDILAVLAFAAGLTQVKRMEPLAA